MVSGNYTASPLTVDEVAAYHNDVLSALRVFFDSNSPAFIGLPLSEVDDSLRIRLEETDLRSALVLLTAVEAMFRIDYAIRCRKKLKDAVSKSFRGLHKRRKLKVHLEDDIFEAWKNCEPGTGALIAELRGAFRFRH